MAQFLRYPGCLAMYTYTSIRINQRLRSVSMLPTIQELMKCSWRGES